LHNLNEIGRNLYTFEMGAKRLVDNVFNGFRMSTVILQQTESPQKLGQTQKQLEKIETKGCENAPSWWNQELARAVPSLPQI
jgi:hypothetical protein